ncbi:MAG TPA: hypothetical protein PLV04_03400 [Phenylobacterium sp.]|jgi:hypothetical protein|uniref:Transcriptional regulator n=1 Tax=Phenylobacterium conjunctum TaxID=1298959 RepID=A0ABW3SYY0_9CAUL|nr:hypothetical protein [Phenylobacterium sp.]HQN49434.1 hypothetical protein [Phenylobacterium sp.]HQP21250.1 hypothetical protein [Phenylobacterium sp.]
MADSMLEAPDAAAPDVAELLSEPGAVELLIAYGRMPHGPARAKLVAFVESLAE